MHQSSAALFDSLYNSKSLESLDPAILVTTGPSEVLRSADLWSTREKAINPPYGSTSSSSSSVPHAQSQSFGWHMMMPLTRTDIHSSTARRPSARILQYPTLPSTAKRPRAIERLSIAWQPDSLSRKAYQNNKLQGQHDQQIDHHLHPSSTPSVSQQHPSST